MKKLPKISRILNVEPFSITLLWSTSEVRSVDFLPLFTQWTAEGDTFMLPLMSWDNFKLAAISENKTLYWPNIQTEFVYKGETRKSALELDALELYRNSVLIKKMEAAHIGKKLRNARMAAGLSQADVALKSGTTRNYISRIENDKSDIQFDTLQKIVELGIGWEIDVQIRPAKKAT